jgi:hypothetical protein
MYMRIGIRTRTYLIATLAVLTATTATSLARAAEFGALQPGSTVCTDWLRSDGGGVYLVGYASGSGTYTWTMRMSSTPGGAEQEIFRAVTRELTRNVVPPTRGRFFYRNCLNGLWYRTAYCDPHTGKHGLWGICDAPGTLARQLGSACALEHTRNRYGLRIHG